MTAECSSPANGAPDHGETVTMSFPLRNVGTGLTADLVATLLPGGGVVAPSGPQSYGVLSPVGPAASRAFSFTASGTCGSDITATFQLEDSGNDLGTVSFPIQIGATAAATATPANPAPITILDSPRTGGVAPSSPYPSSISVSGITGTVTEAGRTVNWTAARAGVPSFEESPCPALPAVRYLSRYS